MAGCALEACGRRDQLTGGPGMAYDAESKTWSCYLCYVMPRLFEQPHMKKQAAVEAAILEERTENPTQDGEPTLAAARARGNKAFRSSQRAGPLWVPSDRRV